MKSHLFILLLVIGSFSCSKSNDETSLPPSIQTIIDSAADCVCEPVIYQYRWEFKKVYVLGYNSPSCSWTPQYFDSDGNLMTTDQGYDFSGFQGKAKLERIVWECGK